METSYRKIAQQFCTAGIVLFGFGLAPAANGQGWSTPSPIAAPDLSVIQLDATVAISRTGEAIAAWSQGTAGAQCATRQAGGSWSSVLDLSGPKSSVMGTRVAIGADGTAAVVWVDIIPGRYGRTALMAAVREPGAASWTPAVEITPKDPSLIYPFIAVDAAGDIVVISLHSDGTHVRVQAIERPHGAGWLAPVELSAAGTSAMLPRLAMNDAGDAVAVWQRVDASYTPVEIHAARRLRNGAWLAPVRVSATSPNQWNPQVGIDDLGRAAIAWNDNGSIEVVRQTRAISRFDRPEALSPRGMLCAWPSVAVNGSGETLVGWQAYLPGPKWLHATMVAGLLDGQRDWTTWVLSDTSRRFGEDVGPPSLAASPDGTLFVATWEDNYTLAARAATLVPPRGMPRDMSLVRWAAPVTLGPDGLWDDPIPVAAGAGGTAQALWAMPVTHYLTQLNASAYGF